MPPKKAVKPLHEHPDCCGDCYYGRDDKRGTAYNCWESPSKVMLDDEGLFQFLRGFPVDKDEPACSKFKPRCH